LRTCGVLLLFGLTALAYLPSLSGGWVYDDHRFVRLNPAVQEGTPLLRYFSDPSTQAAAESHQGLYRPLRTLSFRIVRLLGPGPLPQRVANLLIHLLSGMLVLRLLRTIFADLPPAAALVGAGAFLLHPVAVESVGWISSRGDLLALLGMLGALVLHLREGRVAAVAGPAAFGFALLSKESAAVLPALLVLADAFRSGKAGIARGGVRYAAHLGVLGAYLAVRLVVLPGAAFHQGVGLGLDRAALAGSLLAGYALYVRDLFLPLWFGFEVRGLPPPWLAVAGAGLLVGTLAAAAVAWRRVRGLSLAALWFFVCLLPVTALQLLFPLKIVRADRFAYPALVAAAVFLSFPAARGGRMLLLGATVLGAFLPLTWMRAEIWREDRSLWSAVAARQDGHPRALYGLGILDLNEGETERARERLRRARAGDPGGGVPAVRFYLGEACARLADPLPEGSAKRQSLLREAYSAYDEAVSAWRRGAPEMRHLWRETALRAAWTARLLDRRAEAASHVATAVAEDTPGTLPPVVWTARVLGNIAQYLAGDPGTVGLASRLREAAERRESEGWD
jgi:hypothetical protein